MALIQTVEAPTVAAAADAAPPSPTTKASTTISAVTPEATGSAVESTETAIAAAETAVAELPSSTPIVTETPKVEVMFDLQPPADIEQQPVPENGYNYLDALLEAQYPPRDYFSSAMRLGFQDLGARTVTSEPFSLGDRQAFYTDDGQREAELLAITEHAYFWVETSLNISQNLVAAAADRFERNYYGPVTQLLGEEWRPGVDNDPHFSVMHLDGFSGDDELGFFDSGDEYPRSINSVSNEQEVIYLNMENMSFGDELYFGTLVHELEHLIQWNLDANEPAWMNEGLAQFIELYVGLDTVDTAADYLANPSVQLNMWEYDDEEEIYAHYGAGYLFAVYVWEQLGQDAIMALARHPANGMEAVSAVLAEYRPETTLTEFVGQWAVANYLDDEAAGSHFHYENVRLSRPAHTLEMKSVPFETVAKVNQFAVSYAEIDLEGPTTISFAGDLGLDIVSAPSHNGELIWFVPSVDEVDAQLTAAFDLTSLSQATLEFWAWYDLEEDFDYAYVTISTDGGESWRLLQPDHAKAGEFGPGFTGRSENEFDSSAGWVAESVSLNNFVGHQVLIRFEVLTDSAITGGGFAIDEITIPELGYSADAENGNGVWQANGFVRTGWRLPQPWIVYLIQEGRVPQVAPLALNDQNQGQWPVDLGREGGVLVIAALNPFAFKPASYWLSIEQ